MKAQRINLEILEEKTMIEEELAIQIKTLEIQLAVIKKQIKRSKSARSIKPFADLYGILAGKVRSSEEEIDAVRYGFEWEGTKER
jgi:hypothetical protein